MNYLTDTRIFLCLTPTKMNYSFDSLMSQAEQVFAQNPLLGHLFLFLNRERDRIKILFWDQDGFCIWYKRLKAGTFQLPSVAAGEQGIELDECQLYRLLSGLDLRTGRRRRRYRRAGRRKRKKRTFLVRASCYNTRRHGWSGLSSQRSRRMPTAPAGRLPTGHRTRMLQEGRVCSATAAVADSWWHRWAGTDCRGVGQQVRRPSAALPFGRHPGPRGGGWARSAASKARIPVSHRLLPDSAAVSLAASATRQHNKQTRAFIRIAGCFLKARNYRVFLYKLAEAGFEPARP